MTEGLSTVKLPRYEDFMGRGNPMRKDGKLENKQDIYIHPLGSCERKCFINNFMRRSFTGIFGFLPWVL